MLHCKLQFDLRNGKGRKEGVGLIGFPLESQSYHLFLFVFFLPELVYLLAIWEWQPPDLRFTRGRFRYAEHERASRSRTAQSQRTNIHAFINKLELWRVSVESERNERRASDSIRTIYFHLRRLLGARMWLYVCIYANSTHKKEFFFSHFRFHLRSTYIELVCILD